ncbi:PQQ-binding-like beta-propeller repeat protein [Streptomyces sp. YIM 98790]|uniref:outer membrane protein assembly factor BamB family protein n=1 Tax=Streptomyces sp. YIM 98790 TaxID=2689077 RepID=UPI001A9E38DB|nr:PQQ-binding-like beta-propeller repeat protein [Streptomyces sp. YIM 98790]
MVGIVVAVVVAVLAATGLGGWYFLFHDAYKDQPVYRAWSAGVAEAGTGELLWRTSTREGTPENEPVWGRWLTDTHYVIRTPQTVVSYDLATGEQAWEFPLGEGPEQCPSSLEHSENRVALLRPGGGERRCGTLTVLDIADGEEVFTQELPAIGDDGYPEIVNQPVVFGGAVFVNTRHGTHVLDLGTGERRNEVPDPQAECYDFRHAVFAEILLVKRACGDDNRNYGHGGELRALDREMNELWAWPVPEENGEPGTLRQVVSADPLVVEVSHSGTYKIWHVDPSDGSHTELSSRDHGDLRGDSQTYRTPCTSDGVGMRDCQAVAVSDGKAVFVSKSERVDATSWEAMRGYRDTTEYYNQLVAVDLASGEEVWRTELMEERSLALVEADDERIVAYQRATRHYAPGMVVSVDPASGEISPLLPLDERTGDELRVPGRVDGYGGYTPGMWHPGGFFLLFSQARQPDGNWYPETQVFGKAS